MEDRIVVTIADLFKCFLTQETGSNKAYQVAKLESERWLAKSVISSVRYLDPTTPNHTDQNMRLRSQYEAKSKSLRFFLLHLYRGTRRASRQADRCDGESSLLEDHGYQTLSTVAAM